MPCLALGARSTSSLARRGLSQGEARFGGRARPSVPVPMHWADERGINCDLGAPGRANPRRLLRCVGHPWRGRRGSCFAGPRARSGTASVPTGAAGAGVAAVLPGTHCPAHPIQGTTARLSGGSWRRRRFLTAVALGMQGSDPKKTSQACVYQRQLRRLVASRVRQAVKSAVSQGHGDCRGAFQDEEAVFCRSSAPNP